MNILNFVNNNFDKASPSIYWHHVVKKHNKEDFYNAKREPINDMINKLGKESLFRKGQKGLTPLHIAIITGNKPGASFLLQEGASFLEKDEEGKTVQDYAKELHPELLGLFTSHPLNKHRVNKFFGSLFEKFTVKLSKSSFTYRKNSDDFGREIKKLLLSRINEKNNSNSFKNIICNMKEEVAPQLGIEICNTENPYYVRDHFFRHVKTGEFLLQLVEDDYYTRFEKSLVSNAKIDLKNPNLEKAIARSHSEAVYFGKKGLAMTSNPFFKVEMGHTQKVAFLNLRDRKTFFPSTEKSLKSHFEGGNLFTLTNRKGKIVALISRDHLISSLNFHRLNKTFAEFESKIKAPFNRDIEVRLTKEKMQKIAEQMYSQGILLQNNGSGFLTNEQIAQVVEKSLKEKTPYLQTAINSKVIKAYDPSQVDKEIDQRKESFAKYLLQKDFTRIYMALDIGLDSDDLFFIQALHYHLDTFLKPGPYGSVFVADFGMAAEIMEIIVKESEALGLTQDEKKHAEIFLQTAQKLESELGPLLKKVRKKIEKANLYAIPTPGIFMYENENKTYNINFMNALSGWSSKTQNYYFVTSGAQVDDHLGEILLDVFHGFLNHYQPNIDVFYVGRDPQNPKDYSEVMNLWNNVGTQFGLHCLSFELETQDHQQK